MSLSSVLLRGRAPPGVRRRLSSSNDSLPTESYSTERDSPLPFRRLPNDLNTRSCLCSSADEALVALGGRAGVVQLFEAEKFLAGKSYGVLRDVDEPRDAQVVTMSWSRDLLATGSHAGTKIWDVPEQKVLGHIDAEGTSDVSFNGHYSSWFVLATCARESSVKIWDLRELRSISESSAAKRVLRDHHGHRFRKARWSPAEPYLATIHSKDVWIWDMRLTEKPCTIFSAPGSFNVVDIDWSPKNSDRLISINAAGSMHLWSNRAPKSPIWSQITHRSTLAAFSKDGDAVLALGEPGATLR